MDGAGSEDASTNEGGAGVGGEALLFLCVATIRGGAATESRRLRCPSTESRLSLLSSPEPRLLIRFSFVGIIIESLRSQELGKSVRKSCGAAFESRRLEAMDFMPESAEESRLRRGGAS